MTEHSRVAPLGREQTSVPSWVPVQCCVGESLTPAGMVWVKGLRVGDVRHEAGRANESPECQRRTMHLCTGTM